MNIGIITRCDTTGLGIQGKEFYDHIPCKALVVDVSHVNQTMPQNHGWYPGAPVWYYTRTARFPAELMKEFLMGLDVLVAFETPYDYSIFSLARLMGVKTVLQLNYEFLEYPSSLPLPDLFAAPSKWHWEDIPSPKTYIQVPVNTSKFQPQEKERTFVHIAGKPAVHDRNGTHTFLNCLKFVKSQINVVVRCQQRVAIPPVPKNVTITAEFSNRPNYSENYTGGVLVMPRKYGGLCLPMQEAIAAEMPVITTDISPNHFWLPPDWLVPAAKTGSFRCKKVIDIYEANPRLLAAKIDQFCNQAYYRQAMEKCREIKQAISWENLLPAYLQMFADLKG